MIDVASVIGVWIGFIAWKIIDFTYSDPVSHKSRCDSKLAKNDTQ